MTSQAPIGFLGGGGRGSFLEKKISHHKNVHPSSAKAIERFFGAADDWLIIIERCVQNGGHARKLAHGVKKLPVEEIGRSADRL
jgi:hypothetical protein